MIRKSWLRAFTSSCLVLCLFGTYSMVGLAAPEQRQNSLTGELSVSGQVSVDGLELVSGTTLFSGSTLSTAQDSHAAINLGKLGRVEYLQNSDGKLGFNETGIVGTLDTGVVQVSKPQGVSAVITTKDGSVTAERGEAVVFTVNVIGGNTVLTTQVGRAELRTGKESMLVSAGESSDAEPGQTQGGAPRGTRGKKGLALGIIGFVGIVLAAFIIVAVRDGESGRRPSGNPIVISPLRL